MKKNIILIIIAIILITICVLLSVYVAQGFHNLWLAEYNAQIVANGIYKEDLHLLNQYWEKFALKWALVGAIFTGAIGLITGVVAGISLTNYV